MERSANAGTGGIHRAPPPTLRGRRLSLARASWVALAAVIFGLDAARIPYAYARAREVCTGADCADLGRLTPEGLRTLQDLGLSVEFYAAYTGVGLPTATTLAFAVVAAVIFWRRSDDRIALFGAFMLLLFGGAAFTGTMRALTDVYPAFWFPVNLLDYAGQVAFGVFFYVFPDGRFVPRWTRWLALAAALLFIPAIFFPDSPFNLFDSPLFIGFVGSLVFAQVYRYARVSSPAQRQQTKWVLFGIVVGFGGFLVMVAVVGIFLASEDPSLFWYLFLPTVYRLLLLAIPLSIGFAILRSQLWNIDVVINRALVYGTLTVSLASMYVGGIVVLQSLFRTLTRQQSQLAVVASTLVITALFSPLRRHIQVFIDRRFYRRKYDASKTLEVFSSKLREEVDLDTLGNDLVSVVKETIQPAHFSLWLREPERK